VYLPGRDLRQGYDREITSAVKQIVAPVSSIHFKLIIKSGCKNYGLHKEEGSGLKQTEEE
jgi:hypothetical protein